MNDQNVDGLEEFANQGGLRAGLLVALLTIEETLGREKPPT